MCIFSRLFFRGLGLGLEGAGLGLGLETIGPGLGLGLGTLVLTTRQHGRPCVPVHAHGQCFALISYLPITQFV